MAEVETKRPPLKKIRYQLLRHPEITNAEWGRRWGISRERVRQLRVKLELPTSQSIQADLAVERQRQKEHEKRVREEVLGRQIRPDPCPVCGGKVTMLRKVTCSSGCARRYQANSKYRYRRVDDRGPSRGRV